MVSYNPYSEEQTNKIYNLLFADDPNLFDRWSEEQGSAFAPIFDPQFNERAVRAVADDERAESRLRVLAFNRLRAERKQVPAKKLLGVVIEAPLARGLDTLAAYPDGRLRYINA